MSAVAHIDEYKKGTFYSDAFRGEMSWNGYENNNLLRNEGCADDGTPRYSDVALALGADAGYDARGLAIADFDNDGDLDLAINNNPGDSGDVERAVANLLRNDIGHTRPWLAIELEGRESNRAAVGAVVTVETGDLRQTQQVTLGSSYASQNSRRLHFGLGGHSQVDRLTIRWPAGAEQVFEGLDARQHLRIVEGGEVEVLSSAPRSGDLRPEGP